jgi:hypothetical protein
MHAQGWVQAQAVAQAEEEAQTQAASARARAKRVWWWPRAWVNAKAEALAEALALELAVVHKAVGLWMQGMQGQGQQQVQAWLRVCEAYQVEERARAALFEFGLQRGRYLWLCRQRDHWWLIQIITPITRLPPELLQQILLLVIDDVGGSPLELMRVCKLWYSVVSGIWASLKLGATTSKDAITRKLERNQWLLDVFVDTEADRGDFIPSEDAYQAIFAAMQATSRWRSLVVDTFPAQADLPEDLVNRGLEQCSDPVMSRLRTLIIKCPCEMSPLLERLLHTLGTPASGGLTTVEIRSANVISFLVPTYPSIFRSVTTLSLDAPQRLSNPMDLLPHLDRLETLTASYIPLPVYHDDVDLPFVHTLRHLTLKSVSIQWMSGRTFQVLESCTLIFPLHRHTLHTFCTTLPNCKDLSFEGYPLDILHGISAHNLIRLSVMAPCSDRPRGSQQLVRFSRHTLRESRLAPQILHIRIEATNYAWTKALVFMPNLEELVIDNAQPSSIGVKALRSLVIHRVHANKMGPTDLPAECNAPACSSLRRFGLRYRRWLRPSEHFDLIPVFISIIRSRQQSLQSFRVWTPSDQNHPLELIEGSSISFKGLGRLKEYAGIAG